MSKYTEKGLNTQKKSQNQEKGKKKDITVFYSKDKSKFKHEKNLKSEKENKSMVMKEYIPAVLFAASSGSLPLSLGLKINLIPVLSIFIVIFTIAFLKLIEKTKERNNLYIFTAIVAALIAFPGSIILSMGFISFNLASLYTGISWLLMASVLLKSSLFY